VLYTAMDFRRRPAREFDIGVQHLGHAPTLRVRSNGKWAGSIDLGPHNPNAGLNIVSVGDVTGAGTKQLRRATPSD
jgi:hypothetical protein